MQIYIKKKVIRHIIHDLKVSSDDSDDSDDFYKEQSKPMR